MLLCQELDEMQEREAHAATSVSNTSHKSEALVGVDLVVAAALCRVNVDSEPCHGSSVTDKHDM